MKMNMRKDSGITLMALVITVIILLIIAGIGIGSATGMRGSIKKARENITYSDLVKVQQIVLENYLKYKQTGNVTFLKGEKMSYSAASQAFSTTGSSESLKVDSYNLNDSENPVSADVVYYKLGSWELKNLGMESIKGNEEYIVNYSTGEVFSTSQNSASDKPLYIYLED